LTTRLKNGKIYSTGVLFGVEGTSVQPYEPVIQYRCITMTSMRCRSRGYRKSLLDNSRLRNFQFKLVDFYLKILYNGNIKAKF